MFVFLIFSMQNYKKFRKLTHETKKFEGQTLVFYAKNLKYHFFILILWPV